MINVVLRSFASTEPSHRTFADRAVDVLRAVVNDPRFLDGVRTSSFSSSRRLTTDGLRRSMTPEQVAELIAEGREIGTGADATIDLHIVVEAMHGSTVGYVNVPDTVIHTSRAFLDEWMRNDDPLSLAAHWMHEWMHVVGFEHPRFGKRRDVAYRVGDLVEALGRREALNDGMPLAAVERMGTGYRRARTDGTCPVVEAAGHAHAATWAGADKIEEAVERSPVPVVDVHTHTFNASDLSVGGFLSDVIVEADERLPQWFVKSLVRLLARAITRSPGADAELARLDELDGRRGKALVERADPVEDARAAAEEEEAFEQDVAAAVATLRDSPDKDDRRLYAAALEEAGLSSTNLKSAGTSEGSLVSTRLVARGLIDGLGTIGRHLAWVKRLRRYRHEIAVELVQLYGEDSGRVNLFVSAQVDFAKWLADEPATPPHVQVAVGDRVQRALPGRLHFLAAFDPWRELEERGHETSPMTTVRRAVEQHGFLGVKLYPPMGFSATGNERHRFHGRTPEESRAFGQALDGVLEELYGWAAQHEVPLMAHCNNSNGARDGYAERASPEYWATVTDRHPTLRLNLGHFGGQQHLGTPGSWPEMIIDLINARDHVYADIGMFHLHGEATRDDWFQRLKAAFGKPGKLARHLMYGSDWLMLAREAGSSEYFRDFERRLESDGYDRAMIDDLLGGNAMRFLGLRGGTHARRRLLAYYERHRLPTPMWLDERAPDAMPDALRIGSAEISVPN
jgi:predicted TIM-barrel fold metal-dependent hydrolase